MTFRNLSLIVAALTSAAIGYFFFAIVVAIYAGLWLHDEKMYFAQGISAHLFGGVGAAVGVALAVSIWRAGWAVADYVFRNRSARSS